MVFSETRDEALCIFSLDHSEITWCSSHVDSRSWGLCHLWLCPDVLPAWGSIIQRAIAVQEKWRFIPLPEELKKHAANQDLEGFTSSLEDMFERPPGNVDAFVPAALSTECASFVLDAFREKSDLKTSAVTSQARASRADGVDIDVPALIEPLDIVFLRMKITSVCFGPGGGRMFLNTSPSKKPGFCYLHLNVRQGSSRCTGIENLRSVTSLARCVSFQKVGRVMGRLTFCVVKLLHSSSLLASFGIGI